MSEPNIDPVVAEQARVKEINILADKFEKYVDAKTARDYVNTGKSAEAFRDFIMDKMSTKHSSAHELEIGLSDKEVQRYSIVRAVNAMISGDWSKAGFERAASEAAAKRTGLTPEGIFVPLDVLNRGMAMNRASFDVGVTSNTAGNLVQTTVEGGEFVDVLRNALVFSKLGARVMGGLSANIAIPRKAAASTISNATEVATLSDTYPTTNQITLSPKRVGATIPYSKQALIQSSLDVESMLRDDLVQGIAVLIENLGFNGSGTAPAPRGLVNQSGIGSVVGGTNGAQIAWSHIVGLEAACANANAEPNARAGYAVNTKSRGWMKQTQKATYLPLIWNMDNADMPLNGYAAAVTNNLPSNGTKGTSSGICSTLAFSSDWSLFVLALFGGLDIVVDPYSMANAGQVRITANQFIDIALRQPAAFAVMTDALTA